MRTISEEYSSTSPPKKSDSLISLTQNAKKTLFSFCFSPTAPGTWHILRETRLELAGLAVLWLFLYHSFVPWLPALWLFKGFAELGTLSIELFLISMAIGISPWKYPNASARLESHRRFWLVLISYLLIAVPFFFWKASVKGNSVAEFWLDLSFLSLSMNGTQTYFLAFSLLVLLSIAPLLQRRLFSHQTTKLNSQDYYLALRKALYWSLWIGLSGYIFHTTNFYNYLEIIWLRVPIFLFALVFDVMALNRVKLPRLKMPFLIMGLALVVYTYEAKILPAIFWNRFLYLLIALLLILILPLTINRLPKWIRKSLQGLGKRLVLCYLLQISLIHLYGYYVTKPITSSLIFDYLLLLSVTVLLSYLLHRIILVLIISFCQNEKNLISTAALRIENTLHNWLQNRENQYLIRHSSEKTIIKDFPVENTWTIFSKYRTELMGVAILLVISIHHFATPKAPLRFLFTLFNYGSIGVDIFLLCSAIGLFYAFQRQPNTRIFYRRRMIRLLIPYFIIAIPYFLWLNVYVGKGGGFFKDLFYVTFFTKGTQTFWYVFAAFALYLLYPWFHRFLFPSLRQIEAQFSSALYRGIWLCLSIWLAFLFIFHFFRKPFLHVEIFFLRIPIFIAGILIGALCYTRAPLPKLARLLPLLASWIIFLLLYQQHYTAYYLRFVYFLLTIPLSYLFVLLFAKTPNSINRIFRFLGRHTLFIYLVHISFRGIYKEYYYNAKLWILDPNRIWDYFIFVALLSIAVSPLLAPLERIIVRFVNYLFSLRQKRGKYLLTRREIMLNHIKSISKRTINYLSQTSLVSYAFLALGIFTCTSFIYKDFNIRMIFGYLLLGFLLLLYLKHSPNLREQIRNFTPFEYAWLLFIIAIGISLLRFDSKHNYDILSYFLSLVICGIFALFVRPKAQEYFKTTKLFIVTSLCFSLFILFFSVFRPLFWKTYYLLLSASSKAYAKRFVPRGYSPSLGGSSTYMDYVLFFTIAILIGLLCALALSRRRYIAILVGIAALFFMLLLIGRRGELLVAVISIAVLYFLVSPREKRKFRISVFIITLVALAIIGIIILPLFHDVPMLSRYAMTANKLLAAKDITNGRLELYQMAWQIFLKHPIFGIGWGGFAQHIPAAFKKIHGADLRNVHNVYLEFLCELGIFGTILLVLPLLYLFYQTAKQTSRLFSKPLSEPHLRLAKAMSCTSFLVQTFFLLLGLIDPCFQKILFWTFYAMAISLSATALRLEGYSFQDCLTKILDNTVKQVKLRCLYLLPYHKNKGTSLA